MVAKAKELTVAAVVKLIRLVAGRIMASQNGGSTQEKAMAKEVLEAVKHYRI